MWHRQQQKKQGEERSASVQDQAGPGRLETFGLLWKLNSTLCWMMWRLHVVGARPVRDPDRHRLHSTWFETLCELKPEVGSTSAPLHFNPLSQCDLQLNRLCKLVRSAADQSFIKEQLFLRQMLRNKITDLSTYGNPWGSRGSMTTGSRGPSGKRGPRV